MKNVFNRIIILSFVICHLTLVILFSAAYADALSSGGYTLYDTINSGGMTLQNGGYTLQDSKGEGIAGSITNGGYTFIPGIFGVLGTVEAGIVETFEVSPLNIVRVADSVNSAIKVSWEVSKISNADIYAMAGDGTGKYLKTFDPNIWKPVYSSGESTINPTYVLTAVTASSFNLDNQVGAGFNEVYFKALSHQVNLNNPDATVFQNAPAVGKINISLQGSTAPAGKNLISIPFYPQLDQTVAGVFGRGNGSIWEEGDIIQTKIAGSPAYLSATYSGGQWKNAADPNIPPAFNVNCKFGNWVITKSNKTLSLLGNVVAQDLTVLIYDGSGLATGGKTMLGMLYPFAIGLTSTSLITDGAANGDLVQYKDSPLAPSYISAVISGGQWKNASDPNQALDARIATLKVPNGYLYVRFGNSGFLWNRTKPY